MNNLYNPYKIGVNFTLEMNDKNAYGLDSIIEFCSNEETREELERMKTAKSLYVTQIDGNDAYVIVTDESGESHNDKFSLNTITYSLDKWAMRISDTVSLPEFQFRENDVFYFNKNALVTVFNMIDWENKDFGIFSNFKEYMMCEAMALGNQFRIVKVEGDKVYTTPSPDSLGNDIDMLTKWIKAGILSKQWVCPNVVAFDAAYQIDDEDE